MSSPTLKCPACVHMIPYDVQEMLPNNQSCTVEKLLELFRKTNQHSSSGLAFTFSII